MSDDFSLACDVLAGAVPILVFTGAGISTESGIPDFRGPDGLWKKVDPSDFTIGRYLADPDLRKRRWRMHLEGGLWGDGAEVEPNAAHHAIADLWKAGRLCGVVTQNIDGLHQRAGIPTGTVAELHGNVRDSRCVECNAQWPTPEVLSWVEAGQDDPACPRCSGVVKTNTVMFGEPLPLDEWSNALVMAAAAEAVLVVGSTLGVYPAAEIALEPARRGVPLVIVNLGPTEHDHMARVKLEGRAGDLLPRLSAALI